MNGSLYGRINIPVVIDKVEKLRPFEHKTCRQMQIVLPLSYYLH